MTVSTVDEVLAQRRHRDERRQDRNAVLVALLLHGLMVAVMALPSLLRSEGPQRPRIVPVRLVATQRLGQPEAPPEPPARPRTEPETPEAKPPEPPEPEKTEAEPEAPPPQPSATIPPPRETTPAAEAEVPEPEPRTAPQETPPDTGPRGSPRGDPLGTSAFGARLEGVEPGAAYDSYLQRLLARIEAEWRRPAVYGELKSVLHFVVEADGTVRDLRVVEPSGHRPFDLAAVRAVQNASPLPPLPRTYRKERLGVNLVVQ